MRAEHMACDAQSTAPEREGRIARRVAIGLMAFLTLVDLFAAQAILPTLAAHYQVSASAMGIATNACTLGMAVASLAVASFSMRIDRRAGIVASLVVLALPTLLLAHAPNLAAFAALRIVQGLCMATAFALTLAHLGERFRAADAAAASAAYITGNVASNLVGRLVSAGIADHWGLASSFYVFSALNIAGAALACIAITRTEAAAPPPASMAAPRGISIARRWNPAFACACGIGFLILFAFIGTFTYVNFVLMRAPLRLSQMQLGLVYLVFLPSVLTTPLAGRLTSMLGVRSALIGSLALAAAGLPMLLGSSITLVLPGLALIGVGTFLAQATATGYVSRIMTVDRGTASGLYLGCYFLGGLTGAHVLGHLFDGLGWTACVAGIGVALGAAMLLAARLEP